MSRPLVVAHRGASGHRPEHSEEAYRLAARLGADAIEPDVVATRDGVLVLRHENEISGTTDVAARPEFFSRRTTKEIDGETLTGWFTEDFTWEELSQLAVRERLPRIRQASATFDGQLGILRLQDLLDILDETGLQMVLEVKHATYFASIGLPLDELVASELRARGWASTPERLVVESFEQDVLRRLRARDVAARWVYLLEEGGAPADAVASLGSAAPTYASQRTDEGLAAIAAQGFDGVSVDKRTLLQDGREGVRATDLVDRAHAAGLQVFAWTLRPENRFLAKAFRRGPLASQWGAWMQEWDVLIGAGLDGIFADHPDLAVFAADHASGTGRAR
ncbi:glycerophosphodiester phosphodiesterase family protein [Agrococcus sp. SGAir0287]|uniref:glycerophosphodiester phosphodiesterase family protein n=1 Tax=Agrococcus sp. SGAir0287 TaxID=2070347 RepID=UPI0010CCDF62|nr:glycerophosphodiester phosphodiesterase family protein [Agrococcus sp. SGAir0287]QCR20005.1 glycerophosphodiester phosphodiesterase [Agrococcus sp. SGAir0287]